MCVLHFVWIFIRFVFCTINHEIFCKINFFLALGQFFSVVELVALSNNIIIFNLLCKSIFKTKSVNGLFSGTFHFHFHAQILNETTFIFFTAFQNISCEFCFYLYFQIFLTSGFYFEFNLTHLLCFGLVLSAHLLFLCFFFFLFC